ncbi:MAG: asparagine synthase (glutamine-hydrolyzing) [Burkholderiales bacterium]|nr:asparagine synthase (glutamine-hydrolyzing) [Burkholderiales bacterium]
MCGIAGYVDQHINYDALQVAHEIGLAIYHRGPDSAGLWQDSNLGVNFVHRRLAILDLSTAGHQPMASASGRYIIVFNGEVYNYKRIAAQLESQFGLMAWRGHSDTEVILQAIEYYGFVETLKLLEGMFAIAVWDKESKKLYLARDRIGEKPLYYGYSNGVFMFASELKALRKHPKFIATINRRAIGQYLLHSCVPAPLSILEGIHKLMPAHYLELSYSECCEQILPKSKAYWRLDSSNKLDKSVTFLDASIECENLLSMVIQEQMLADVPLGCFLSGGVDSSLIAAMMQKNSAQKVKTFTIGFNDSKFNEAHYANEVAQHLGTEHTELYVSNKDALETVAELAQMYDEPFCDSSQIPTFLVSKMARQHVTVALSGDGGDEIFTGYQSYILTHRAQILVDKLPDSFQAPLANILKQGNKLVKNNKINRLEQLLNKDYFEYYLSIMSDFIGYKNLINNINLYPSAWWREQSSCNLITYLQDLDRGGYLPDDILVKVDRAAMYMSLETRAPFLNHKVVEFASSLPLDYKLADGRGKIILRDILYRYVPRSMIERPKHGFGIPLDRWLRDGLKPLVLDLLSPQKIEKFKILDNANVQEIICEHMNKRANHGSLLWKLLILQQWLECWS